MSSAIEQHSTRLAIVCGSLLVSVFVYAAVVYFVPRPVVPQMAQLGSLIWLLAAIVLLNLVTLTPVSRAMLAGPRRVFSVSRDLSPLLGAHLVAQVVVFTRLEATAILGLLVYFITGSREWFWGLAAIALTGMVLLWPSVGRTRAALGLTGDLAG
jgi:hypothetical protein